MLVTAELAKSTPRIGAFDNAKDFSEIPVSFKLFDPVGAYTYYVCEFSPDDEDDPNEGGKVWGYVTGMPYHEVGYTLLSQMREAMPPTPQRMFLGIERDRHWPYSKTPTLADIVEEYPTP